MKHLLLLISTLFISQVFAQDINQFDTNGERNGVWRKNYEGTHLIRYEGQFNHGKEIGLFKFYKNIDGKSVLFATKQFNPNNNIVEVKFYTSNGNVVSQGKMDGKKYVGKWLYYDSNSKQLMREETFDDNGLQQGELLVYYKNGTLAEKTHYKDGKLDGLSTIFSEDGKKLKEFAYKNDQLDGPARFYSSSGGLIIEGQYKQDKKYGVWKYYENGKLLEEKDFTIKSKNPYKK